MTDLPSQSSAYDLVTGQPGAVPRVAAHVVVRAGLIAIGLYAAGARKDLARHALGGSLSIEAFVLAWAIAHKDSP